MASFQWFVRKKNSQENNFLTEFYAGGNWMYFENGLRDFVTERKIDLVVYTGTHGVCQLEAE